MDSLFNSSVLVSAAFVLTFVPGLMLREGSPLSMGDRGRALLVCVVRGSVEKTRVLHRGWFNGRIVAVRAAGLLTAPLVGVVVSVFVAWLAGKYDGVPLGSIGVSMWCGGLAGGWLYQCRPKLAQRSPMGFCLGSGN